MKASSKSIELIKEFEGFSSEPYICPGGKETIGYGSTRYNDGTPVTIYDQDISEKKATEMLDYQVNMDYAPCVDINARNSTQYQFDAMTSFTYNLGCGNFKSSTLLKKHNTGDYEGAAKEFLRWNKAGGEEMAGLTRRREAESEMYKGL